MNAQNTQAIIIRLLGNLGSQREVSQYLRNYASVEAPKFAMIKVSGRVVETALEEVASSLSFLKAVGLVPIVVHGSHPQVKAAPKNEQRKAILEVGSRIVEALEKLGTRTRPFTSGVIEVENDDSKPGAKKITQVFEAGPAVAAQAGAIPVISPFGETKKGQIACLHANDVARELSLRLMPHKVVFLSGAGGLRTTQGELISAVNLAEDYERIMADATLLDASSRRKLGSLSTLLESLPPTSSASVTAPSHLARELFTHGGAGTLVRWGERVGVHHGFDGIDTGRLRALLEECFTKSLHDNYFDLKAPHRVYLAESYRATAIVTLETLGARQVPYLDKFAVTPEAQGEGVGGSIWQRMRSDLPQLFWRSRADNPINGWYAQKADGLYKGGQWWVFWCNMPDFSDIQSAVERALSMPATFDAKEQT